MNCIEFEARLHPYVDGELSLDAVRAADSHVVECRACGMLAQREREFLALVRRQPCETSPSELRARIVGITRREGRHRRWRPWVLVSGLVAIAVPLATVAVLLALRPAKSLVTELVDKHIAYAQVDRPAELASSDPKEIVVWFRERAGLRVVVPDYSASGIQLMGARLANVHERTVAYLLYKKGRTLLSVFAIPIRHGDAGISSDQATYHGAQYGRKQLKDLRIVSWSQEGAFFALIAPLDEDVLLECAERLRRDRERQSAL